MAITDDLKQTCRAKITGETIKDADVNVLEMALNTITQYMFDAIKANGEDIDDYDFILEFTAIPISKKE